MGSNYRNVSGNLRHSAFSNMQGQLNPLIFLDLKSCHRSPFLDIHLLFKNRKIIRGRLLVHRSCMKIIMNCCFDANTHQEIHTVRNYADLVSESSEEQNSLPTDPAPLTYKQALKKYIKVKLPMLGTFCLLSGYYSINGWVAALRENGPFDCEGPNENFRQNQFLCPAHAAPTEVPGIFPRKRANNPSF